MTELEVSFRAALHEGRFSTAAVLLAQVVTEQAALQESLPGGHEILLQRHCVDLIRKRPLPNASTLLQEAAQYASRL